VSAPEPPEPGHPLPDAAYRRMTLILRAGLVTALSILLVGLVAYLVLHPGATSGQVLSANPILSYLSIGGLASGLASGALEAYLTLGLLVLLATPIVRVVAGSYYFARGGERAMTVITAVVFVLLLIGVLVIGPYVR
jgi:uncharacterized membrane protein